MKYIAVILLVAIVGCGAQAPSNYDVEDMAKGLTYFRDVRTGLCFASIASTSSAGYQTFSIATVPCEKVGKLIQ